MGKSSSLFAAVLLILAAQVAHAQPQSPTGTWAAETATPYNTQWGASCGAGSYVYAWGGNSGLTNHFRYDPVANSWLTLASVPSNLANGIGVNYGNFNYSFGNSYTYGSTYKYDITLNTWATLAVTNHHYRPSVSVSGNYIYIMGGYNSTVGNSNFCTRWDPSNDTPTPMTVMLGTTSGAAQATSPINNKIYVTFNTSCWEFDPAASPTGGWLAMPNVPLTRIYHTSFASLSGRIYVVGGNSGTLEVHEFFPGVGTGVWTRRADALYAHTSQPGCGFLTSTGKAYVWGTTLNEEFTPPTFGSAPNPASAVIQNGSLGVTLQAGANPDLGWTNANISFRANCTDPDLGQWVRFEVQVKPSGTSWQGAPVVSSTLDVQGNHNIDYPIPAGGGNFDWQYRVVDAFGNYTPNVGGIPDWTEFMNNSVSPDFRSDQILPSVPNSVYPDATDVQVMSLQNGDVTFTWDPSTDNGPAAAITYEIMVAFNDPTMGNVIRSAPGLGVTSHTFNLNTSSFNYYWTVRSKDIGGNHSPWSPTKWFRVVPANGLTPSHANQGLSSCGMSMAGAGSSMGLLLALVALAGIHGWRR